MIRRLYPCILLVLVSFLHGTLYGQVQVLGRIIGQVRAPSGDVPPHQIMVELRLHGGAVDTVFTDSGGRFGFSNLHPNGYRVVINDEDYYPVEERADVIPDVTPY